MRKNCIIDLMDFASFRRQVKSEVIDYQLLAYFFRDFKKIRDKIRSLVLDGQLIRVKKELYVFGENWRLNPLNLEMIANLIYGPSCISFEYALMRYGFLAERSFVITSLAIGDSKVFKTPIGTFTYRAIDADRFKVGIEYRDMGNEGGYFIASREKAIADLVYRTPGIRSLKQLRFFLFEEMRIDETLFRQLDFNKLKMIAKIYNKKSVYLLGKL